MFEYIKMFSAICGVDVAFPAGFDNGEFTYSEKGTKISSKSFSRTITPLFIGITLLIFMFFHVRNNRRLTPIVIILNLTLIY